MTKRNVRSKISPLLFCSLTFPISILSECLLVSRVRTYLSTNQQHGIPCLIKRGYPPWLASLDPWDYVKRQCRGEGGQFRERERTAPPRSAFGHWALPQSPWDHRAHPQSAFGHRELSLNLNLLSGTELTLNHPSDRALTLSAFGHWDLNRSAFRHWVFNRSAPGHCWYSLKYTVPVCMLV